MLRNCKQIFPQRIFPALVTPKKVVYNGGKSQKVQLSGGKGANKVDESRSEALTPAQSALLDKYRHLLRRGFRGTYVHGLDAKGRMIVPAAFRQALGEKFIVCMAPDFKAIALFSQHEWELYYCSLLELMEKDMRMERIVNLFSKYTYEDCECDAQGRVLLPQKLRSRFLEDAKDVEVSGAGTHIRVMRPEDAQPAEDQLFTDIPDVLAFEAEIAHK